MANVHYKIKCDGAFEISMSANYSLQLRQIKVGTNGHLKYLYINICTYFCLFHTDSTSKVHVVHHSIIRKLYFLQ